MSAVGRAGVDELASHEAQLGVLGVAVARRLREEFLIAVVHLHGVVVRAEG